MIDLRKHAREQHMREEQGALAYSGRGFGLPRYAVLDAIRKLKEMMTQKDSTERNSYFPDNRISSDIGFDPNYTGISVEA